MARPEMINCEVCGVEVDVASRGRVPRFCADHTAADLPAADPAEWGDAIRDDLVEGALVSGGQKVELAAGEVVIPLDDGWPQQVAPVVWVGPNGERWTDQGEAERAVAEWRAQQ